MKTALSLSHLITKSLAKLRHLHPSRILLCRLSPLYIHAQVSAPTKVFLLRGNHELRDVNSWEEFYGEGSFLWQCRNRFGAEDGELLWEAINTVFDRLPLAAVVDQDVFCIHGRFASNNARGI